MAEEHKHFLIKRKVLAEVEKSYLVPTLILKFNKNEDQIFEGEEFSKEVMEVINLLNPGKAEIIFAEDIILLYIRRENGVELLHFLMSDEVKLFFANYGSSNFRMLCHGDVSEYSFHPNGLNRNPELLRLRIPEMVN